MGKAQEIVLLRNSERSTYRECRLKWDWSYNRKLAPPREKGALTFGRLTHSALEVYYPPGRKRGPHPAVTFEQLYRAMPAGFSQWDEEGNKVDALELGIAVLYNYVEEYGKDDNIEIIQPEQSMQVDVFTKQGKYLCTWVGQCDAMYVDLARSSRRKKVVGLLEHKTAKTIEEELRINTGYGEQGLSYIWAAEMFLHHHNILAEDEHLDHVLFNWLKKTMPDKRPTNASGHRLNQPTKDALSDACAALGLRQPARATRADLAALLARAGQDPNQYGEPSKRQPGPALYRWPMDVSQGSLQEINRRIRAEAWEMAQVRAGKLPIYKNPTKDCSWKCAFKEACELHEMGHDYEDMLDMEFTTWNPYEAHELEEEKA